MNNGQVRRNIPELRKINLQSSLVYGPVDSRRLGKSLGISPMLPGTKVCSFNCVYCQYEAEKPVESLDAVVPGQFAAVEEIIVQLREALTGLVNRKEGVEFITFAGNGEPTLHPDFPKLVREVMDLRDLLVPAAGTAVLTNGTTLVDEQVHTAVGKLDVAIVKLDAASIKKIRMANRPYGGFDLKQLITALTGLDNLVIQSLFFEGRLNNATETDITAWIETVGKIRPRDVQIYSVDRAPAEAEILPLSKEKLLTIADRLRRETSLCASVY